MKNIIKNELSTLGIVDDEITDDILVSFKSINFATVCVENTFILWRKSPSFPIREDRQHRRTVCKFPCVLRGYSCT